MSSEFKSSNYSSKIEKTISSFNKDLITLRTGRANASMLDKIRVDVYGQQMPINQLATISVPESRLISIQVWDKGNCNLIDSAIQKSDLGINPQVDGQIIRLRIPDLTEERRKDLIKILKNMSEKGKAGYIASFPIPEVVRGINAFYLGATTVNPDFDIDVVWVNTWYDPSLESDAAKALIQQGADIITQHTDSPAALQVAQQNGVKAFGQASDMINFAPDTQLTAILDIWGPYYVERVKAVLDGTWEKSDTWGGMDTGMVEMAPYTNMPDDVKEIAMAVEKDILEGKLDIFPGKGVGDLLGMNQYVEGIDAFLPD